MRADNLLNTLAAVFANHCLALHEFGTVRTFLYITGLEPLLLDVLSIRLRDESNHYAEDRT
jgi:hypothetical protein